MACSEHTGGWSARWEASGEYVYMRGPRGGHIPIGKALAVGNREEQEANARLMATAPQMLSALRTLVEELDECPAFRVSRETRENVDSAIAAATGEKD